MNFAKDSVIENDLDQAKEAEADDSNENQGRLILYHYTNRKNLPSILTTQVLLPSLKANNPNDARHGNGQYFTDLNPYLYNSSQIAQKLISWPNKYKYNSYVAIDVTGLNIENPEACIYVHKSQVPLNISGRIVGFGTVSMKKKEENDERT